MKEDAPITISIPRGIYTLQDNGLRCFVPPCFSWNVINKTGQLVATVSDVDISCLEGFSGLQQAQASLANEGLLVRGYSIPLPETDGVRQAIRFVVVELERPPQ
jgi:hypothetical protein